MRRANQLARVGRTQVQLFLGGELRLFGREITVLDHQVQDHALPRPSCFGVNVGVVCRRRLDHAREQRPLCQVEVTRGLAEIGARGSFHAVCQVPKIRLVEVHFENLVFGVGLGEPQRQQHLAQLAGERARFLFLAREQHLPRQLLGNCTAARDNGAREHVLDHGARNANGVHARMRIKVGVLDRDDCLFERRGQFAQRHAGAATGAWVENLVQEFAVAIKNLGRIGRGTGEQGIRRGQVGKEHERRAASAQCSEDQRQDEPPPGGKRPHEKTRHCARGNAYCRALPSKGRRRAKNGSENAVIATFAVSPTLQEPLK